AGPDRQEQDAQRLLHGLSSFAGLPEPRNFSRTSLSAPALRAGWLLVCCEYVAKDRSPSCTARFVIPATLFRTAISCSFRQAAERRRKAASSRPFSSRPSSAGAAHLATAGDSFFALGSALASPFLAAAFLSGSFLSGSMRRPIES